jgi:hypothetical protein
MRLLKDDDPRNRHIITKNDNASFYKRTYSFVPENAGLQNVSLSRFLEEVHLDKDEEYLVKKYIYNHFLLKRNLQS